LEKGEELLNDRFYQDERFPDLFDQFTFRADINGCHKYFLPSSFGSMMEQTDFLEIPASIQLHRSKATCASFMGLLPEIHRAFITVDNVLYLWDYYEPDNIEIYDGASEVIVSVTISVPKTEIFAIAVKYILIIATSVDISILAVCGEHMFEKIKLIPTTFRMLSNGISVVKIIGSQVGRVFVAGNDQSLFELDYSYSDGPLGLLIGSAPKPVCKKINLYSNSWKLNDFVRPFFPSSVDEFADVCVDNYRNILYSVTGKGLLNAFYLGEFGVESVFFVKNFDVLSEVKIFLATSKAPPESSPKIIRFSELNSAEFNVVSIQPISSTESLTCHIVILLSNGIRIFAGVLGLNGFHGSCEPTGIEIQAVRSPPSVEFIQRSKSTNNISASDLSSLPHYAPSAFIRVGSSFHSHGVTFVSLVGGNRHDELLCLYEDLSLHGNPQTQSYIPNASMKESLSYILDVEKCGGLVYDVKEDVTVLNNEIYRDINNLFSTAISPNLNSFNIQASTFATVSTSANPLFFSNSLSRSSSNLSYGKNNSILGEFCYQHLPVNSVVTQRQFIVLTDRGIVIIKKLRPCDILYRILSCQSYNPTLVEEFFSYYGFLPSSIMCAALSVGLPCDAGGTTLRNPLRSILTVCDSSDISVRAMDILLKCSNNVDFSKLGISSYQSLCNYSLYAVFSRIVRPIWNLPASVSSNQSEIYVGAAKMQQIKSFLRSTKELIYGYFSSIIRNEVSMEDSIRFLPDSSDVVTAQMFENCKSSVIRSNALVSQIGDCSETVIKSLYFLCTRTLQTLTLLEIVSTVQDKICNLKETTLKTLNIRSIVLFPDSLRSVRSLLRELFSLILDSGDLSFLEAVLTKLSAEAYYFFPWGDRYTYEAILAYKSCVNFIKADGLLDIQKVDPNEMNRCINFYSQAAEAWTSEEYVIGSDSELSKACESLLLFQERGLQGIVTVCLKAAMNFSNDKKFELFNDLMEEQLGNRLHSEEWDSNVFFRNNLSQEKSLQCIMACYECLTKSILSQLDRESSNCNVSVASKMIQLATSFCSDIRFHNILYENLYDRKYFDSLLIINSCFIEDFLKKMNPFLLFDYLKYSTAGRNPNFLRASELMCVLGMASNDVEIDNRLMCLQKASLCLKDAIGFSVCNIEDSNVYERLQELEFAIKIAGLQKVALERLQNLFSAIENGSASTDGLSSTQNNFFRMEQLISKLKFQLIDVSSLYSDICLFYNMFDLCLHILFISHEADVELINDLWSAYIYSELPKESKFAVVKEYLNFKKNHIESLGAIQNSENNFIHTDRYKGINFESTQWFASFLQCVKTLILALGPISNSVFFPLKLIVSEFEQITAILATCENNNLKQQKFEIIHFFDELEVSFHDMQEVYFVVLGECAKRTAIEQLQVISSISVILRLWLEKTKRGNSFHCQQDAFICINKVRNGEMQLWLENLKMCVVILEQQIYDSKMESVRKFILEEIEVAGRFMAELTF